MHIKRSIAANSKINVKNVFNNNKTDELIRTANHESSQSQPENDYSIWKLFRTSLLYQTREFFNYSTLHGVRYIAENGRPFSERFMWFCFNVTGAIAALIIIFSLWEKFQTNPTITGLDTDFNKQQIVFPSVVVCPFQANDPNRTYKLASILANNDIEKIEFYETILTFLTQLEYSKFSEIFMAIANGSTIFETNDYLSVFQEHPLRSLVFEIAVTCNETLEFCKFRDEEMDCCEHFSPMYTELGFCYGFNVKYYDTIDAERMNRQFLEIFKTDRKWSLYLKPILPASITILSVTEHFGWNFDEQLQWNANQVAELLLSVRDTYTTEDARQLSIVQRKCIFNDEIKLDIFNGDGDGEDDDGGDGNEYTFSNCVMNCRIKKCIKFCQCIPPFYRPVLSIPYCKLEQFECIAKFMKNITNVKDCPIRCELACVNTVYNVEKLNKAYSNDTESSIIVDFLNWPLLRYKREVLFGWVDLLVSFGGIAGLFLGFSLLSAVEIVYYFTMRACCMLYKDRDELKTIENEKELRIQKYYNLTLKPIKNVKSNNQKYDDVNQNLSSSIAIIDNHNRRTQQLPNRYRRAQLKLDATRRLKKLNFNQIQMVAPSNNLIQKLRSHSEPNEYGYIP